jgi:hypothetical protein
MAAFSRVLMSVITSIAGLALLLVFLILFHLGGITWEFSQLTGALVGGSLTLFAALYPMEADEKVEPWLQRERQGWIFVGCGLIMWGLGECVWRYYVLTNQSPFPSFADLGYSSLPPLVFIGLLLQPFSGSDRNRRMLVLDSMIAMGSMLSIGWYLLLGSLALASSEDQLAKFLGLYYPVSDIALLSCIVFLLLRSQNVRYQARARRIGLLIVGIGLGLFATSDFIFNIQQNAGTYVDGTWIDLGWPLGLLTMSVGAYVRRFLPLASTEANKQQEQRRVIHMSFGPAQSLTYLLVAVLFAVLSLNIFSSSKDQIALRPVLLLATITVVALVVVRQILTILDNDRLAQRQSEALERIESANQLIEQQSEMIARRNIELERGIQHLKDVHARISNGHLQARARLIEGDLLPLAGSLNLMAERLQRLGQADEYATRLSKALSELAQAFERYKTGRPFVLPSVCNTFPEIKHLLAAIGFNSMPGMSQPGLPQNGGPSSHATSGTLFPTSSSSPSSPSSPKLVPSYGEIPPLEKPKSSSPTRPGKRRQVDPMTPLPRVYHLQSE